MSFIKLSEDKYSVSRWSGGTTTQLAIAPAGALYADRNFIWRVSSATVEMESTDFTLLPNYNRWITVLEGEVRLCHGEGEEIPLSPYKIYAFDGGAATSSRGKCTDFNLMTRKDICEGSLETAYLDGVERKFLPRQNAVLLAYCAQGNCVIAAGQESLDMIAGESALMEDGVARVVLQGDGVVLIAQMYSK